MAFNETKNLKARFVFFFLQTKQLNERKKQKKIKSKKKKKEPNNIGTRQTKGLVRVIDLPQQINASKKDSFL